VYDFDNEERAEDDLTDEDTNNNNDNFYITASPSSPDQDEAVDITVEARDSSNDTNDAYRGTVRFKVERKS